MIKINFSTDSVGVAGIVIGTILLLLAFQFHLLTFWIGAFGGVMIVLVILATFGGKN